MEIIDLHSHWGTQKGYVLRSKAALDQQKNTWNSTPSFDTEEQMVSYFRSQNVKTILDFGFTKNLPIDEVIPLHDYAIQTQATYRDCIFGNWIQINPRHGKAGADELERCIKASKGFVGFCVSASGMGFVASDPIYGPFYEVARAYQRPVLVLVGHTGAGAGLPGGDGIELDLCHPRYIDKLAIAHPDLQIISGRPAWPWQDDMISIMLHKPNVWSELHGWSPKYFTDALKKEIRTRLKKRVMFGADYPLFRYERLVSDWQALGYDDETLKAVFHGNAQRLFGITEK
jgi:predicted TIM-barrel fold metal-dependent hydrolase